MKSRKNVLLIESIVFIALLVIVFAIPSSFTAGFWIAFGFTVVSFGINVFTWLNYFKTNENLSSRFLNISILSVCNYYTIVQLIVCLLFKFVPGIPTWVACVICVVVLALALVFLITVNSTAEYIQDFDKKVQSKTIYIKFLHADMELIADSIFDREIKTKMESLIEKIRFSDPMSDETLAVLEERIADKVEILKTLPEHDMEKTISEIEKLLDERNKKCKILK